jgi:glycosyltransferase involved in cell wall biosynthesis
MSALPRLSVGLPVYNGERFLRETLDSILSQTFTDFELIISDNASSDGTGGICKRFQALDSRITYYRNEKNLGAARNYNRVFELSCGEYFKWAAHDDLYSSRVFELAVRELDNHPETVLAYPQTVLINAKGKFLRYHDDKMDLHKERPSERFKEFQEVYRAPYTCNPIVGGLVRSETLRRTPCIERYVSSDMILLGELTLHGEIHELSDCYFYRRDHKGTSVHSYPSLNSRIAWFDPAKAGRPQLTRWYWLWGYLRAIKKSPISRDEKLRCYLIMNKWFFRNLRGLSKDTILYSFGAIKH